LVNETDVPTMIGMLAVCAGEEASVMPAMFEPIDLATMVNVESTMVHCAAEVAGGLNEYGKIPPRIVNTTVS